MGWTSGSTRDLGDPNVVDGESPAVGPGIGQETLLIQILRGRKRVDCGEAQAFVGLPLKELKGQRAMGSFERSFWTLLSRSLAY